MNEVMKKKLRYMRRCIFKRILRIRVRKIKKRIKAQNKPLSIFFIVQFPEMWNSEKSIYEKMIKDSHFCTKIICVPKVIGRQEGVLQFDKKNAAYEFLSASYDECIDAHCNDKWFDFSQVTVDYIFLQRPYDYFMPDCYSQYELSKESLLCYVPYGFQFVNGVHLDIEYNDAALNNLYMVFADNIDSYNYVMEHSSYEVKSNARSILNIGYPRFDVLKPAVRTKESLNTVLWLPRWSTEEANDASHFFDYFDKLISYFQERTDVHLIIRPHPLMFSNFIKKGILSQKEVNEIKMQVLKSNNISFDENVDYIETFKESDLLISDFTSMLIEFFSLKKPIIYCGVTNSFNSVGKKMDEGLYHADNWEELKKELNNLLNDNDRLRKTYVEIATELLGADTNIGERICSEILKDATT